jgi:hypothetical protein
MENPLHYLNPTANDEALKNTRWRNIHTGATARIVDVHRIRGANNPIAELEYDEQPEAFDEDETHRWDNGHLLRHWTPIYNEEEE